MGQRGVENIKRADDGLVIHGSDAADRRKAHGFIENMMQPGRDQQAFAGAKQKRAVLPAFADKLPYPGDAGADSRPD